MNNWYTKIKTYYKWGSRFLNDPYHTSTQKKTTEEIHKTPSRTDVINYLLNSFGQRPTTYLEIGVRNPEDNFNHIIATKKYSVDPGIEFKENPVDFKLTSNDFFNQLKTGVLLDPQIRFDVIFIDGLHLADQVTEDIYNALEYITKDGFIVLHDCNPPTEWHAREEYLYDISPAMRYWSGTTWKAFYKQRFNNTISCACINSDWGLGIITKDKSFATLTHDFNPFLEFHVLNTNRKLSLNLMSFEEFKKLKFQQ